MLGHFRRRSAAKNDPINAATFEFIELNDYVDWIRGYIVENKLPDKSMALVEGLLFLEIHGLRRLRFPSCWRIVGRESEQQHVMPAGVEFVFTLSQPRVTVVPSMTITNAPMAVNTASVHAPGSCDARVGLCATTVTMSRGRTCLGAVRRLLQGCFWWGCCRLGNSS